MSKQYPGGLITKTPVVPSGPYETSTASGIWTLDQQAYWRKLNQWPIAGSVQPDPQFNYVTMLLHGDGTNGAQNNTFLDSSTNAFSITRNGNTTQGSFSPYGSNWSASNNGVGGNYLSFASNSALNQSGNLTIEMWVFLNATPALTLSLYGFEVTNFMKVAINNVRKLVVDQANVGERVVSTNAISLGTWAHICLVRNGTASNNCSIYINGGLEGQFTDTSTATASGTGIILAKTDEPATQALNGYVSNFRVTNTAVYTAAFTPSTTPLTAISGTSLLTCQSNRFRDASANNFTITINGTAPSVQRFNPFGTSTAYSTSVIGGSGYFDGSGDYLTASSTNIANFGTGDFIVSAWFNCSTTSSTNKIFDNYNGNNNPNPTLLLNLDGAGKVSWYAGQTSVIASSSTFTPNTWNYVVVSRVSSTTKMFLNGTQVGSVSDTRTYAAGYTTVGIGGEPYSSGGAPFPGYITDLQVVKGSGVTSSTVPTAPVSASGSTLHLGMTNGAIYDNAMMNDLETVGDAQISTTIKKFGTGSMYFDGTGDYLSTPSATSNQMGGGNFTIEAWIYPTTISGTHSIIGKYVGGNVAASEYWLFVTSTGKLAFAIDGNGGENYTESAAGAIVVNTWTYVAAIKTASAIGIYVNGTQVNAAGIAANTLSTNTTPLNIGSYNNGSGLFVGYIDDLRLTKGVARTITLPTAAFPNIGPT